MITASIVTYKTKVYELKAVLDCVLKSSISTVFVIDNSPNDELRLVVERFNCERFVYVFGHGNIGFGSGHNISIRKAIEAGSKYHVVLNADIVFREGSIEQLSSYMENHADIGQIFPKVIYPNGELQYLCKLLPSPLDIFGRRLLPKSWIKKRNEKYEMHFTGYDKIRNCPTLSGCFMILNVDVLMKVGLFDDRFFMYFEDNDLTRRIHQISKTVFYPKVTIIHKHAAEHRHNRFLLKVSIYSAIKYFNKWGWLFDPERRRVNKQAFSDENILE